MCVNNVIQSRGALGGLLSQLLLGPCLFTQTHVVTSRRTTAHVRALRSQMSSRTRANTAKPRCACETTGLENNFIHHT